jgi:hypothetical protein
MKVTPRIAIAGAIAANASSVCWSVTSSGVEVNVSMMLILEKSKCILCLFIRQDEIRSTIEVGMVASGWLPAIQKSASRPAGEWLFSSSASRKPVVV